MRTKILTSPSAVADPAAPFGFFTPARPILKVVGGECGPRVVRVVASRRVVLAPPPGVRHLSAQVDTPIYDRLAWERGGSPLDRGACPAAAAVVAAMAGASR